MVRVWRRLRRDQPAARLLLQVHDELLIELPEELLDPVRVLVVQEMEQAAELAVPLLVETGVGRDWQQAH